MPEPVPIGSGAASSPQPLPDLAAKLIPQLRLARLQRLTVGAALVEGDCTLAAERIEVAARQVRALLAERLLLFGLVGAGAHSLLFDDAADALAACDDVEALERVLAAFERESLTDGEGAESTSRGRAGSCSAEWKEERAERARRSTREVARGP